MKGLRLLGSFGASLLLLVGCNLGPFPGLLEPLDPLDPVEGEAKGWVRAEEDQTRVLVLSEGGQFLHAEVGHNTSVRLEFGTFEVEGEIMTMNSDYRYEFPKESGPIGDRIGSQSESISVQRTRRAELLDGVLSLEGLGTFAATQDFFASLDLDDRDDRGCMLRFVQISIRMIQARIRNFGAGGTIIYQNNESVFEGFLQGTQSIVVEGLLSPETIISYDELQDIPDIELDGTFSTFANTSGNGHLEDSVEFRILSAGSDEAEGSAGAPTGSGSGEVATGSLHYGDDDPLLITTADVSGGSYRLEMKTPLAMNENFGWEFLEDLDLGACYEWPEDVDLSE